MSNKERLGDLSAKEYDRPDGFAIYGIDQVDGVETYGDIIFANDKVTFVLPEDSSNKTPAPSHRWFSVGNPNLFKVNNLILVDTIDGKSSIRRIKEIDGRVIILKDRLNHLPLLGGDVIKVLGVESTYIDRKASESANKNEDKTGVFRY